MARNLFPMFRRSAPIVDRLRTNGTNSTQQRIEAAKDKLAAYRNGNISGPVPAPTEGGSPTGATDPFQSGENQPRFKGPFGLLP